MHKLTVGLTLALSLLGASAHAAKSILINKAPARRFIESLANKSKTSLKLSNKLDARDRGLTAAATEKAAQALGGLEKFGRMKGGGNFVVKMGHKKMIMTVARDTDWFGGSGKTKVQRFILRSGRSGQVVARGFIGGGKITWTRMHNEHAKGTPAERNAAD
jgi:hypothetical protein